MNCSDFEDVLSDYLERTLEPAAHRAAAAHALSCPLCHGLLNDVKQSLAACREMAEPKRPVTRLEARILERTMPNASMSCDEFESFLTDYLDGFLPAAVFHRLERHAVLCDECSDLPGTVVRSIAACVTYKLEELPLPAGLHERILRETLGTQTASEVKASAAARFAGWIRGFSVPISIPQLAPVAMLLMVALFLFSQTVSADGSLHGVYTRSFELAERTYQQGSEAIRGGTPADSR